MQAFQDASVYKEYTGVFYPRGGGVLVRWVST